jgi:hypothetical protein
MLPLLKQKSLLLDIGIHQQVDGTIRFLKEVILLALYSWTVVPVTMGSTCYSFLPINFAVDSRSSYFAKAS